MRWAASLVCILCLLHAAAALAQDSNGLSEDLPRIRHIEIRGNEAVGDGKIRSILTVKSPSLFRPFRATRFRREFLDADVRAVTLYYRSLGYLQAKVTGDTSFDKGYRNASIRITVSEGRPTIVRALHFKASETLSRERLRGAIRTKVGKPYNEFQVRDDREALRAFLQDLGYLTASVADSSRFDSLDAALTFDIREGREMHLREVSVSGNEKTETRIVARELVLRTGDLVRRQKLLESQKKLYESGLFLDATIRTVVMDSSAGVVDLLVNVRERKDSWIGFGVGYSSRDLARLSGEWGNRNIGGAGRRLTAQTQFGLSLDSLFTRGKMPPVGENVSQLSWREPWFLGTRTPLQFTGYYEFSKQKTFDQSIWGLKSTARRDLSTAARVFLTAENRWVTTTDSTLVRERYTTRLLDLRHERDTRDDFFDPGRGTLQQSLVEYSGGFLGGQSTFGKASLGAAWYSTLNSRMVIAWRARSGVIEPVRSQLGGAAADSLEVLKVPFEDRFFAGGASTVRGYPEQLLGRVVKVGGKSQPLGGLAMLVANVELRVRLIWLFSAAFFVDGGNVWADRREFKLSRLAGEFDGGDPSDLDVKYGAGVGLRARTPVGPLRVDYGQKIGRSRRNAARPYEFHLSVGQAF
jgi:outer membrane protein assembly complex protein YaeT